MITTFGNMKKIGILIDDGYHDLEFWIPYYRLKEENIEFDILAWEDRAYKGQFAIDSVKPTKLLSQPLDDYGLIFSPGAKSPENLLKNPGTVPLVREMYEGGTTFATICHSPLLLAEAGLIKGMKIAGHPTIKPIIEKAGATYVDLPIVKSSEQLISGRTHFDLNIFMPELLREIRSL
jgi:protease I